MNHLQALIQSISIFILIVFSPMIHGEFAQSNSDPKGEDGMAILYGKALGPPIEKQENAGSPKIFYSGDQKVIMALAKVRLENINEFILADVSLQELSNFVNARIPININWRLLVDEDAKNIRVSGTLNEELMMSLIRLMHDEKFHCVLAGETVRLKRGRNSLLQKQK